MISLMVYQKLVSSFFPSLDLPDGNNELNERWLDVGETSYFAISILARSFDRA